MSGPGPDDCLHETLGIVAPRPYWAALGCTVSTQLGDEDKALSTNGEVELLVLGIAEVGASDHRAVIWAIKEKQRRREHREAREALAAEARAIEALAQAITVSTDSEFLDRLLVRLSEPTRYAIRAQLKALGSPI